ncbi:hypothetical protein TNCV_2337061 [Trichonephila clavipes]|nr:hypothetical protein TNCV_2337061 [Trichonephila clavipes]
MTPHKPRKPAPVEYTTDEEDVIVYDIEEEVESTKSIVRRLSAEYWQNEGVLEEAKFFGVESLVKILESKVEDEQLSSDNAPLTRRDVINILISTSYSSELRFQPIKYLNTRLAKL